MPRHIGNPRVARRSNSIECLYPVRQTQDFDYTEGNKPTALGSDNRELPLAPALSDIVWCLNVEQRLKKKVGR